MSGRSGPTLDHNEVGGRRCVTNLYQLLILLGVVPFERVLARCESKEHRQGGRPLSLQYRWIAVRRNDFALILAKDLPETGLVLSRCLDL